MPIHFAYRGPNNTKREQGPWGSTSMIPGATGSTVYDRNGDRWTRDLNASPSWSRDRDGHGDDYSTEFGPFTNYPKEKDMATQLVTSRLQAKEAIAAAEQAIAEARAQLASLTPDEPGPGEVIRFKKYRHAYSYAAINAGGRWFLTQDGTRPGSRKAPKSWDELLEWIGDRNWETIEVLS